MNEQNHLLDVRKLKKYFPVQKGFLKRTRGYIKAVDEVDFFISDGETLGLVGESGCGKTTVGRSILRLIEPTGGDIVFKSKKLAAPSESHKTVNIREASPNSMKLLRQDMQIIFQDPYSSLDPRMNIAGIVGEPLRVHGIAKGTEMLDRVEKLLCAVGLDPAQMKRYPHEFSGGQRQRIGIARALALDPQLVIADEPVSALDVSIQAQVTNLLQDLQKDYGFAYLFISHDLSIVKYTSARVAVMYLGKIIELARTELLFSDPKHPYTEALMSAVAIPDPDFKMDQILLEGDVPSPLNPPPGCFFHPRCRYVQDVCRTEQPVYQDLGNDRYVACHLAAELSLRSAPTVN
jgi:peptide/nickel transport system ATP-binding protein